MKEFKVNHPGFCCHHHTRLMESTIVMQPSGTSAVFPALYNSSKGHEDGRGLYVITAAPLISQPTPATLRTAPHAPEEVLGGICRADHGEPWY